MAKKKQRARPQVEPELWERQPGEGDKPWEAFVIYRDMGTSRGLRQVAKKLDKSMTLIGRWSKDWNWGKRAAAWDAEQDRIARDLQIEEIKDMRKRHAKLAKKMLDKASAALKLIEPEELRPSDISKLVETAAKLERVSRGDAETIIESREGEAAPSAVQFYIPDNGRNNTNDNEED